MDILFICIKICYKVGGGGYVSAPTLPSVGSFGAVAVRMKDATAAAAAIGRAASRLLDPTTTLHTRQEIPGSRQ